MKVLFAPGSRFTRLMFWGLLALITVASLIQGPEGEMLFPHQDKLHHAIAYLSLYSLGWWSLYAARPAALKGLLVAGLVFYGMVIEYLQGLTGYRELDAMDLLANLTGIGLGVVLVAAYLGRQRRVD